MSLLKEIKSCGICADVLPLSPRPILQFSRKSKILLVGQAPGIKAHESGKPWNDASGVRLRDWLQIPESVFYDPAYFAIVPMAFCYPGRGKSGDNPPRPECSIRWMDTIISHLSEKRITVLVGAYSAKYFFGAVSFNALIKELATNDWPYIALPHPSPRNNIWLAKNQWFENKTLPLIRKKFAFSMQ